MRFIVYIEYFTYTYAKTLIHCLPNLVGKIGNKKRSASLDTDL